MKIKKNLSTLKQKKKTTQIEKKIPFSVTDFRNSIKIEVIKRTKDDLIINIIGLDLSFVNGIRRSLLSEIKSICIDRVFFYDNSSILNDEVLSHRLGLVPLLITTEILNYFSDIKNNSNKKIIFELNIKNDVNNTKKISIYSKNLKFRFYGVYFSWFKNFQVQPVFKDILIAKLNPGQKIKCECHCQIGKGEYHAKFSPVGTAFYRVFPRIKLVHEILNDHANDFIKKCPVSVFDVQETPKRFYKKLIILNPEYCTICRECINFDTLKEKTIRLGRIREKATFIIESTGISAPENLFHRAICLLTGKCNRSISILLKNFKNKHLPN
nr:DNA-directed RNA polymerase 40k chain [Cryptomonas curvata]